MVKENKAVVVPKMLSPTLATLIEPTAAAGHAVRQGGNIRGNVLVQRAGTMGQLTNPIVRSYGAATTVVTDLFTEKLQRVEQFGVGAAILIGEQTIIEQVCCLIGNDRIEVVFDCVCNSFTMNTAMQTVKKRGRIVTVGVPSPEVCFDLCLVMFNELEIKGCHTYNNDFPEALRLIEAEGIQPDGYVSEIFALDDINEAFPQITENKHRYTKCLIKP